MNITVDFFSYTLQSSQDSIKEYIRAIYTRKNKMRLT